MFTYLFTYTKKPIADSFKVFFLKPIRMIHKMLWSIEQNAIISGGGHFDPFLNRQGYRKSLGIKEVMCKPVKCGVEVQIVYSNNVAQVAKSTR